MSKLHSNKDGAEESSRMGSCDFVRSLACTRDARAYHCSGFRCTSSRPLCPLDDGILVVEKALNAYQDDPDVVKASLPGIATAAFDFKTVVDNKVAGSISFLIVKTGATVDKQATSDVDCQYAPRSQLKISSVGANSDFQQQLSDAIKQAARTVAHQEEIQRAFSQSQNDPLVLSASGTWSDNRRERPRHCRDSLGYAEWNTRAKQELSPDGKAHLRAASKEARSMTGFVRS